MGGQWMCVVVDVKAGMATSMGISGRGGVTVRDDISGGMEAHVSVKDALFKSKYSFVFDGRWLLICA